MRPGPESRSAGVASAPAASVFARRRLVETMLGLCAEQGYVAVTVRELVAATRVSRATFYRCFDGLEECFLAVMEHAHVLVRQRILGALDGGGHWRGRVREAMASVLLLFQEEPALARVCFVETLAAGVWALERRDLYLRELVSLICERLPRSGTCVDPLVASAVMEAVLGVIQRKQVAADEESLLELLGPLMSFVVATYEGSGTAISETEKSRRQVWVTSSSQAQRGGDALEAEVEALLVNPRATRIRACLGFVATHPSSSNRAVARGVGINSPEQASRILSRLQRLGLVAKAPTTPGGANAWFPTPLGNAVHEGLSHIAMYGSNHCVLPGFVADLRVQAVDVSGDSHGTFS